MEISMKDLFPVCVNILDREKTPIHYRKLTELALVGDLKICLPHDLFLKNAENVREKLLCAEQRGTFYTGLPLCMGALRHWFKTDQLEFTTDFITIQGNAQAGASGAFEALMRSQYMIINNPSLRNTEMLNRARSAGMVLEHHISEWFQEQYPTLYQPPDNHGIWSRPCNHDFKLLINGRSILVDVAGPDWHGKYGKRGRKPKADVHLLCRMAGKDCVFEGVVGGESFSENVVPMAAFSPTAFLVWLNCCKTGIDYNSLVMSANNRFQKKPNNLAL